MIRLIAFLLITLALSPAHAAPETFKLDPSASDVAFTYTLQGNATEGSMPVSAATLTVDLSNISKSEVDVTLAANKARAGLIFATEAMKSKSVLNTKEHPTIRFQATKITGTLNRAEMEGNLTIRGVTRPVTLQGQVLRQAGTPATERDRLAIRLTGAVDRTAFEASGYPDLVGPTIELNVLAIINREK